MIATYNLQWAASDGFVISFPVFIAAPYAPFSLAGYGLRFAVRQQFGDTQGRLVDVSLGAPSPGGSSIVLGLYTLTTPPVPCLVTATVSAADAADLFAPRTIPGQTETKFYYQIWYTAPGAAPLTLLAGTTYMRSLL